MQNPTTEDHEKRAKSTKEIHASNFSAKQNNLV